MNITVSSSVEVDPNKNSLFRHAQDGSVKLLSQSLEFEKDDQKVAELKKGE